MPSVSATSMEVLLAEHLSPLLVAAAAVTADRALLAARPIATLPGR